MVKSHFGVLQCVCILILLTFTVCKYCLLVYVCVCVWLLCELGNCPHCQCHNVNLYLSLTDFTYCTRHFLRNLCINHLVGLQMFKLICFLVIVKVVAMCTYHLDNFNLKWNLLCWLVNCIFYSDFWKSFLIILHLWLFWATSFHTLFAYNLLMFSCRTSCKLKSLLNIISTCDQNKVIVIWLTNLSRS